MKRLMFVMMLVFGLWLYYSNQYCNVGHYKITSYGGESPADNLSYPQESK